MNTRAIALIFVSYLYSTVLLSADVKIKDKELREAAKANFVALPKNIIDVKKNADLITLGKRLYFEKKMSINNSISCNSCHNLDKYGVDLEATSPGHDGTRGERNSPTVYNAALNFVQFWDGRAKDVEEQAIGPILNPIEHGMPSAEEVMKRLADDKNYVAQFSKAFGGNKEAFIYKNVGVAIGAFERTLLTPSRFDDYLNGKNNALTNIEKKGLKKFIEVGCIACHNGVNIGGNSFQKLGAVEEYLSKDTGRYHVTKNDDDKFLFKVPTLRNIIHTAPYFHDGSLKTLEDVIKIMGKHQLGVVLTNDEIVSIKIFLATLSAKKLKY